jgi:hypothetical protein
VVVLVDCGEVEKAMEREKDEIDVLAIGEVFCGQWVSTGADELVLG